jgi:hypothetical protein
MNQRIFSVGEAISFIPWLREQLGIIRECFNAIEKQQVSREGIPPEMRTNGFGVNGSKKPHDEIDMTELVKQIEETVRQITGHGILLRDLRQGLVDFPSVRQGEEIYLCWMVEEKELAYWHPRDTGVAGRRPL